MAADVMLSSALVAMALGAMAWVLISTVQPARARSLANLQRGVRPPDEDSDTDAAGGLAALARRLTVPSLISLLERQHARAGRPASWPIDRLLILKLVWIPIAATVVVLALATRQEALLVLVALGGSVLVYFLPELLLLSRGQERAQRIQVELADTLDQMTIAVEAGLGFDAAMNRAAANGKGALAEELTRTLQDLRMGRSRRQAFQELADRNDVADLRTFVRAILQADAHGISIGDVLRTQSAEMRMKRRQRAEEAAQKVPVKVLFPLMVFILPVMFIVILGPAGLSMIQMFTSIK